MCKIRVRLLRMQIQGMGHGADSFIVRQRNWPFATTLKLPAGPGAVQGVLQDGELVGVFAAIVEEPRQQDWADSPSAYSDRPGDSRFSFIPG